MFPHPIHSINRLSYSNIAHFGPKMLEIVKNG